MKIWLVTVGEPLPSDPGTPRLLRAGILADRLWRRGHEVIWWSSTFDHRTKRHRHSKDHTIQLQDRYQLRLLKGPGYRRNVSVSRLIDHRIVAQRFSEVSSSATAPDVILASFPTIELSAASSAYGARHRVPVVVDIRDLWPEIFLDLMPRWVRPAGRWALSPMYREARRALIGATAIVGNSSPFVEWGVRMADRNRGPNDREFPFGYNASRPSNTPADSLAFWKQLEILTEGADPIACFFGTLGRQFDIHTIISAARLLEREGTRWKFVVCGDGEQLVEYRTAAAQVKSVVFPGWVDAPKISALMSISTVGLAPYVVSAGFIGNLPNKPIEYLSASLPVVTSLDGYLGLLLREEDCGVTYEAKNPESLARTLNNLLIDPARLSRLKANARRVFEARFSADVVYGEFAEHLEAIGAIGR